jgi:glycosyltransferase involved in cell wall biosynthesis
VADVTVCNTVSLPVYLRRVRRSPGRVAVVLGRMPKGQNRAYGGVDMVLATSRAVADRVILENPRLADRIVVFPNPIDWTLHRDHSAQDQNPGALKIGYVGRIHPEKGLDLLVAAASLLLERSELPAWDLTIIGPVAVREGGGGEAFRDGLISGSEPRLKERLQFLPPVYDPVVLARHYGGFDVFCYPSRAVQGEGLSIAPMEAMAAGAVPVVSRLDCYRDIIVPGENGLQFDQTAPTAARDLAGLLGRLLGDVPLRRALAARAQQSTRAYDYSVAAGVLLERFARLTARPA